jgi:ankyrin repeat protein
LRCLELDRGNARLLIDLCADIDVKDNEGCTALHEAALSNSLDVARLLIESGADIEAKNDDGYTALQEAAWKNSLDVARLLIERGAKTEGIDLSSMN